MLSALAACETQSGAVLKVSFASGSVDHLEFFFAQANADPLQQLRPIPQLAPTLKPTMLLRDYAANDTVTVAANDSSYVYFVSSSAAPKGDKVVVVGYLAGKPVSLDRETVVVSAAHVNEYVLELVPPGATDGLADFGRDLYRCVAVKNGAEVDAITSLDDIDCDGIKTEFDNTSTGTTCDIEVLDRLASPEESCDGRDSGGDCVRFHEAVKMLCAQTDVDDSGNAFCRLGSSLLCDDSSPAAARKSVCDGVTPESANQDNAGQAICVDPLLCARPGGLGSELAALAPAIECKVTFRPGQTKSCTKFKLPAAFTNQQCLAADYIANSLTSLKVEPVTGGSSCAYVGEVLTHDASESSVAVGITLPVDGRTDVRRLTIVKLKYDESGICGVEHLCTPIIVNPDGALLPDTCQ